MQYLKGLNTLRFFAALLVLTGHARSDLANMDISHNSWPFLYRGGDAVQFFFTLSGFLLTYLSLDMFERKGHFNVLRFYRNRALRIWPLYYLCVITGSVLLAWVLPAYPPVTALAVPVKKALPYYLLFLPNYITALYPNGNAGVLFTLWSIGVEEQFYLFFPLLMIVILKSRRPVLLPALITIVYTVFYYFNSYGFFHFNTVIATFIVTLNFQFMFMGCLFAVLYKKMPRLLQKLLPDKKITQVVLLLLIAIVVFINVPINAVFYGMACAVLYACFIINTFSATRQAVNLENPFLSWLGSISYGIYMFHPFISYALRFAIIKCAVVKNIVTAMPVLYYTALLAVTIGVAHISYKFFEVKFLRLKHIGVKQNSQWPQSAI